MASSEESKVSPLPKACENCRVRKIRCNRANPCSNCSSSGIECKPSSKKTEHRPRMIVSNHYEQQIDQIHERLAGIELAVRSFSISQSPTTPQSRSSQPTNNAVSISTPNQFEGDSSFQSQSIRASKVAQSLDIRNDQVLSKAIDSLKAIESSSLASAHDVHFTRIEDRVPNPPMELLPAEVVIRLLARVKEKFPASFLHFALPDDGRLERYCQRTYFPTDRLSLGEMTFMYGMMTLLFEEYLTFNDPIIMEMDCKRHLELCEKNFHIGIETYEVLVDPSFENASALLLGANKAQDEGRLLVCWTLASAAARQSQALGYHREATYKNSSPVAADMKRRLFWSVYSIEKNMALNLGRASSIQDWDIDVEMFTIDNDPGIRPWDQGAVIFTKMSRLQGQIYEQLYSPSASTKSQSERLRIIDGLSNSLDQLYRELRQVDWDRAIYQDHFKMFYEASDVIYFSLLTLLHRGTSNTDEGAAEISSKCFEAAKTCLKCHLHYFPLFAEHGEAMVSGYVNWILLYCSFTPFIVVFLHAIASTSLEDIKILQDMTASLEPIQTLSPVLDRLYNTCRVFATVATALVKTKTQLPQSSTNNNDNETRPAAALGAYDQQTDSLVFPGYTGGHSSFDPQALPDIFMQGNSMDPTGASFDDMSAYFGNWVGSNQPVIDLFNMNFGGNAQENKF